MKLQGDYERFEALGAEIVALGVETLDVSTRLAQHAGITYPILADPEHRILEAYGVYDLFGDGRAAPSVFVLDEQGVIIWKHVGADRHDWPDTEVILEQLR